MTEIIFFAFQIIISIVLSAVIFILFPFFIQDIKEKDYYGLLIQTFMYFCLIFAIIITWMF